MTFKDLTLNVSEYFSLHSDVSHQVINQENLDFILFMTYQNQDIMTDISQ